MKISLITVCYNSAATIAQTIESVAAQNNKNIEYIVIDGESTDMTLEILKKFKNSIDICISEPDLGIYDAMNKGISLASGEVIGFLNADDFYPHGQVLTCVADVFKDHPSLDALYSDLIYVDQHDTSKTVRYWKSNAFVAGAFSLGWCPPHPTFFVRKVIYERFGGFDTSYQIAADVELMMRFLEVKKISVKHVPSILVKMRTGGTTNKSWRNIWKQNQEVLFALKSYGLPTSFPIFFARKVWSRARQFLR